MKSDSRGSNEAEMIRLVDKTSGGRQKRSVAQAWAAWNRKWEEEPGLGEKAVEPIFECVDFGMFVEHGFSPPTLLFAPLP